MAIGILNDISKYRKRLYSRVGFVEYVHVYLNVIYIVSRSFITDVHTVVQLLSFTPNNLIN